MTATNWYATGTKTTINGLKVFFQRSGQGENLFCIHGFPTSSWDFAPLWPALSEHFTVIAADLIGLGQSAKPVKSAITVKLQADIIEGLAQEQGIKKAHLLAHDLGDTVAQELLARQLDRTAKVEWLSCIFLNGGIFPETHRPLLIQKLLLSPLGPLVAQLSTQKTFRNSMVNIFSPDHPPSDTFIQESWQLMKANQGIAMIPKLIQYMRERNLFRERWVTPLVQRIIPIRLINGSLDPISGKHAADRFAEVIPLADIVRLDKAGHYPHVETPQAVLDALFDFHNTLR